MPTCFWSTEIPLEDINLIADPHKNFVIIMKDGEIYKNTVN